MSKKPNPDETWKEFASPERMKNLVGHETADGAHFTPSAYGFEQIAQKIQAKRKAWFRALDVPRGLTIPDKPLPEAKEELEAELAAVTKQEMEVTQILIGPSRPPDGPECEALGRRMVDLRHRRWKLTIALRDYRKK